MKTILLLLSLSLVVGCSGRENGWEHLTTGSSGPTEPVAPFMTVVNHLGYVELFFKNWTPPSDSFSYSDERFPGRTLVVYAQIGQDMVPLGTDKYQISGGGSVVTFYNVKTSLPTCSSIQIDYSKVAL